LYYLPLLVHHPEIPRWAYSALLGVAAAELAVQQRSFVVLSHFLSASLSLKVLKLQKAQWIGGEGWSTENATKKTQ
jgi:hypothetical protein